MSTKFLARTVIEGGRNSSNKFDRRYSNTQERAQARAFLSIAARDAEEVEGNAGPKRRKVVVEFSDKLSPTQGWIRAQLGRRWDDVYRDLRLTFDSRTTAGRHILFDHLLRDIDYRGAPKRYAWASGYRFYVDADGVLRERIEERRRHHYVNYGNVSTGQIAEWLCERRVGVIGDRMFWFVPTAPKIVHYESCERTLCVREHVNYRRLVDSVLARGHEIRTAHGYRQGAEFSVDDQAFWRQIGAYWHKILLEQSPLNK